MGMESRVLGTLPRGNHQKNWQAYELRAVYQHAEPQPLGHRRVSLHRFAQQSRLAAFEGAEVGAAKQTTFLIHAGRSAAEKVPHHDQDRQRHQTKGALSHAPLTLGD